MYKNTIYLCLLSLMAPSQAKISEGWNALKGLALGSAITVGGIALTDRLAGENATAFAIGAGLSALVGITCGARYIIAHDPEYRFEELMKQYDKIQSSSLLPVLQNYSTVHELIAVLGHHYAYDRNPYYEAFVDMTNMRRKMRDFMVEAEILYDHFHREPDRNGNYCFVYDPHADKGYQISKRKKTIQQYDELYAQSLALLKSTSEYRESVRLQQIIEQTEHLERIEQLAWMNATRPNYIYINGK